MKVLNSVGHRVTRSCTWNSFELTDAQGSPIIIPSPWTIKTLLATPNPGRYSGIPHLSCVQDWQQRLFRSCPSYLVTESTS